MDLPKIKMKVLMAQFGIQFLKVHTFGVYDAIAHFNIDSKAAVLVYEKLGMLPGWHMLKGCLSKNESRTIYARGHSTISKKMRRRYNRAAKKHKSDKTNSKGK